MERLIRNYLDDFWRAVDRTTSSPNSVNEFYDKWHLFIELVTSVRPPREDMTAIIAVARTCAMRCARFRRSRNTDGDIIPVNRN